MTERFERHVTEQERAPRRRTLKGAYIYSDTTGGNKPCVLRNISDTGALLQFESTSNIPDQFILGIELDGTETPAKVVRQDGDHIGAQFTGDQKEIKPSRIQIVNLSDPPPQEVAPVDLIKKDIPLERAQPLCPSRRLIRSMRDKMNHEGH